MTEQPNYVGINVTLNGGTQLGGKSEALRKASEPDLLAQVKHKQLIRQGVEGLRRFLLTHHLVQTPEVDNYGRTIRPVRMKFVWIPRTWNTVDKGGMPGDRALLGLSARGSRRG